VRHINSGEGVARTTIQELIAGPTSQTLYPTIPSSTILEDINITKDGLCIVDFSPELVEDHPGGSLAEQLTIYSIVNTLTQFDSVDKVRILVGGRVIESIAGHCDTTQAMARYEDIID
ncbi:MAG: GerMN domain-containing protein, partial [Clostridiales bacterium]